MFVAIGLAVLLAGIGAALALSGGDADTASVSSKRDATTSTTVPETSATTAPGAPAASQTTTGRGGNRSGGGGGTTTTATTTTTTTPKPKPAFTSYGYSPGLVVCPAGGGSKTIDIYWTTTNATSVDLSTSDGTGGNGYPSSSTGTNHTVSCTGGGVTATLTAHGPGGDVTVTTSANFTHPPPP